MGFVLPGCFVLSWLRTVSVIVAVPLESRADIAIALRYSPIFGRCLALSYFLRTSVVIVVWIVPFLSLALAFGHDVYFYCGVSLLACVVLLTSILRCHLPAIVASCAGGHFLTTASFAFSLSGTLQDYL